jgi:hypothetical protein
MTGHTPTVKGGGSDESDTDQRERWRRMRAGLVMGNCESLSAGFRTRQNEGQRDRCRIYLVAQISFRQRVRWSRFVLV